MDDSDVNEVAGLPVAGFVGILIGVLLCIIISLLLLRYVCFSRKYQTPEMSMEAEMGPGGPSSPNVYP